MTNGKEVTTELDILVLDQGHQINQLTQELIHNRNEREFAGHRILELEREVAHERNLRMRAEEDLAMYKKQAEWITK